MRTRDAWRWATLLALLLPAALWATGCFSYNPKEPLVVIDSKGYAGGGARPDTQVKSTDSDEVRVLKLEVARLQRENGDLRRDLAQEKAKRKAAEDRLERRRD